MLENSWIPLCSSADILEADLAVPFDVIYGGQTCRAFAVRFEGQVQAYLNRCTHVAMEMDFQADRFFDTEGRWLVCASHGAMYAPDSGDCVSGPCRDKLVKIHIQEIDGVVYWCTQHNLKPVEFL